MQFLLIFWIEYSIAIHFSCLSNCNEYEIPQHVGFSTRYNVSRPWLSFPTVEGWRRTHQIVAALFVRGLQHRWAKRICESVVNDEEKSSLLEGQRSKGGSKCITIDRSSPKLQDSSIQNSSCYKYFDISSFIWFYLKSINNFLIFKKSLHSYFT